MCECEICTETYIIKDFTFLPCAHKLCTNCYNKMTHCVCPFCKYNFEKEYKEINGTQNFQYGTRTDSFGTARTDRTNRTDRTARTETIDSDTSYLASSDEDPEPPPIVVRRRSNKQNHRRTITERF